MELGRAPCPDSPVPLEATTATAGWWRLLGAPTILSGAPGMIWRPLDFLKMGYGWLWLYHTIPTKWPCVSICIICKYSKMNKLMKHGIFRAPRLKQTRVTNEFPICSPTPRYRRTSTENNPQKLHFIEHQVCTWQLSK